MNLLFFQLGFYHYPDLTLVVVLLNQQLFPEQLFYVQAQYFVLEEQTLHYL